MHRSCIATVLVLSLSILAAGCSAPLPADEATAEAATSETEQRSSECGAADRAALEAWADRGFAGAIALLEGTEPRCLAGFGTVGPDDDAPVTPATVFSTGSVAKTITAAGILRLAQEGRLELDAPIAEVVTSFDLPDSFAAITPMQLLLHTAGLPAGHAADTIPLERDDALRAIVDLGLRDDPGRGFSYSNSGFTVLAALIDMIAEQGFRGYLVDEVMIDGMGFWFGEPTPAGPRAVGVFNSGEIGNDGHGAGPWWGVEGAGGMAATVEAMARWSAGLFDGALLDEAHLQLMTAPGWEHADDTGETVGWVTVPADVFGTTVLGSSGGGGDVGHTMVVAHMPELDRTLVLAGHRPEVEVESLARQFVAAIAADEPLPTPAPLSPIDAVRAGRLAGSYVLNDSGASLTLRARTSGDRTIVEVTPGDVAALPVLFPPPPHVPTERLDEHEALVREALQGGTPAGEQELRVIAREVGQITSVDVVHTTLLEGEVRTYVVLAIADGSPLVGWLSLTPAGEVAGADYGPLPKLRLDGVDGDALRASAYPVEVRPRPDGGLEIRGPSGRTTASPA